MVDFSTAYINCLLFEKENSKPIYKNVITCGAHTLVGGWRLRISHMARLNFDFYLNLFYNIYKVKDNFHIGNLLSYFKSDIKSRNSISYFW